MFLTGDVVHFIQFYFRFRPLNRQDHHGGPAPFFTPANIIIENSD